MAFLEEGKKSGANLILGGSRNGSKGYFIQPTIFQNVTPLLYIFQHA
jgi:acyl-CoA reductase-like NAD-dependent aldehyde dehydrogenase